MYKNDNINYDNVKPFNRKIGTKKVIFNDQSDIIFNVEKEKNVNFSKNINFLFFLLTISFSLFVSFSLLKISYQEKETNIFISDNKKIKRGKILDRNKEIIATSLDTNDLYIDIKKSLNKSLLRKELQNIFLSKNSLFFDKKFAKNQYTLIQKDLSLSELSELSYIGDPAIKLHKSQKRVYPQHNIFAHLTGLKTQELSSKLEKNLDHKLSSGTDIKLTVDLRVQNIVRDEIKKSIKNYKAKSGLAIVMNVNNGEILAMVSLPDFDPNYPESILPNTENNLATEARYEMGSTLKIFNAAIVYELKSSLQNNKFNISEGYQITDQKNISDEHIKIDTLTFEQIFIKSSNVGSVKILDSVGYRAQKEVFEKVGLTRNLTVDGIKIVPNKLPDNWDSYSRFMSYGYGISISPLSLTTAFSSLVNGGYKINPTLVQTNNIQKREKVLSDHTSKKINQLIQKIVNEGTGKLAKVDGIIIGGKTGTSKKVEMGNYTDNKVVTSFIGTFPANKPEFLTFVLFDEPKNNISDSDENTGGNTAAPTFSKIVKKISPIVSKKTYFENF